MKKLITYTFLLFCCNTTIAFTQGIQGLPGLNKTVMPIGAYYYPEQWKEDQWERDIERMASLGFSFTHFAEFAWSTLEPEEGQFNFSWLDKNIALAGKYGLKVILCTPSAAPPAWLTEKHPEILIVTDEAIQIKHGTRLNANAANPVYQQYLRKIITKLADRYGKNPIVIGWQVDNEPHYEGLYDYSVFAQKNFTNWLKNKHRTIDKINKAWGAAFWSFSYNNFEQVRIPNVKETHTLNPHALLDFQRYSADALASAIRFQSELLRSKISKQQWITTNYAYYKFLPSVDLFRNKNDLDFASHTMYLLSTFLDTAPGDSTFRLGSGLELSFSTELAKSINGYTGIMELQPGQINWGQWNAQPLPGAVRMWIWHCYALGDQFACTYLLRQPLFGSEQFHKGILEPDGVTVSPGGKEYVTTMGELRQLKQEVNVNAVMPKAYAARSTAFLWKQDNLWDLENSKHTNSWDTWKLYYTYYNSLKSMGAPVTFITEKDSFDVKKFPYMVAPAYEMTDERLIKKWRNYVQQGGHLIISSRTAMKDNNAHLWETLIQQPIYNLIGADVEFYDQLPPAKNATVVMDDKKYSWNVWGDILQPRTGTEVWAVYGDQFYKDRAAVVKTVEGKGTVHYVGVVSANGRLEKQVLRKLFAENKTPILDLPDYVFTEWRDGYWITVNYSSETVVAPLSANSKVIVGDRNVPPGGVTVWKE